MGAPLRFACPGVDGTNTDVRFCNDAPTGLTVDSAGNLYTTDMNNGTVRKVAPAGTNWVVTTIAGHTIVDQFGNPSGGYADGIGTNALFSEPFNLTVDAAGNIYVADTGYPGPYGEVIRKITPVGSNWVVTTIAGSVGVLGSDDGVGSSALFYWPYGIAVDSTGNLYVADYGNDRVTKGTPFFRFQTSAGSPRISDGFFQMRVSGPFGSNAIVEASANLQAWTPLRTNALPPDGLNLSVPLGADQSHFFRARLAP